MTDKRRMMEEKVELLNSAARAYYQEDIELMSNKEYDRIYDELQALEEETGIVLAGSPTARVGYEIVSDLPKEKHPVAVLSLDKTKDPEELREWLGDREGLLSWKLDGLTIVMTYEDGKLVKAVTRGDGVTGEVITNNAKVFENVPLSVPYKGDFVVRGEAVINYDDFEKINNTIEDLDARYKNPRNLCSGTVRQLNNEITAQRHVNFYAFSLAASGRDMAYRHEELEFVRELGFDTVDYVKVDSGNLVQTIGDFEKRIVDFNIPSDGLVLIYDDIAYGRSLGRTAKFPKDAMAFKWKDEIKATRLDHIIWNVSRTGLINPIAVFDPVELEGTTVSRASVHNLSIVEELELGEDDEITVYKANMIIPQIEGNNTRSGKAKAPSVCPVCGNPTEVRSENGVKTLHCNFDDCPAKRIKAFTHFAGRNAMNIEGLSEATLEKFIDEALIREFADIFRIGEHRDEIVTMEGFGEKSFEKLLKSLEKASRTVPAQLLMALGIPNIGGANAKMIAEHCRNDWEKIKSIGEDELCLIDGVGDVMARAYVSWFRDEDNIRVVEDLEKVLDIDESYEEKGDLPLDGLSFVITGKVERFSNRDEMKKKIEDMGGKVMSSVSAKTSYLINNDIHSSSSKNRKAKELDIEIITEETAIEMMGGIE